MDVEVRDLQLVAAVAKSGTLTRASEDLHVTQSALSHQLRRLEDLLGVNLFTRGARKMCLTPAGERLLHAAHAVLDELGSAERAVREAGASPQAILRLTTECYMCYDWLPAALRPFRKAYPHIRVQIDTDATLQPLGGLADGQLDVAVMCSSVPERSFFMQHLFDDELLIIVAPDHPLAAARCVQPADLATEQIILWMPPEHSTLLNKYLRPAGVKPAGVQVAGLTEAVLALVKAGTGVGFMPRWTIQHHVADGSLKALPMTADGCRRTWHAVMRRATARLAHVQHFVRLLVEHAPRPGGRVVDFPARHSEVPRELASGTAT